MRKILPNKRVIRRFLFIPKILGNEWRWLEFANIEQVLKCKGFDKWIWINSQWKN